LCKRSISDLPTIAILSVTLLLLWKVKRLPEPAIVALAALAGLVVYPIIKT
jgi:chromate transporter